MSKLLRFALIAIVPLIVPACYSGGGNGYNPPAGAAGSPGAFSLSSPANASTMVGTMPTFDSAE